MYTEKCVFVLPTYNTFEKQIKNNKFSNVCEVLDNLISSIEKKLSSPTEIILINDGSTDRTKEELEKLLKRRGKKIKEMNLKLTLIEHVEADRVGLNNAVVHGYTEALKRKPSYIIKIDTDGEHDPRSFPKLIETIRKTKDTKFVSGGPQDAVAGSGFGFRIIEYEALKSIIEELEAFTIKRWNETDGKREKQRGIDRITKRLIEEKYPDDWEYTHLR